MSEPFRFKQFSIHQEGAAMKVGTDGVLLGAWTPIPERPGRILDVGSGSGLIALMLAQRSGAAEIDALEINPEAYRQCVENFEASPWANRLFCYHGALADFADEIPDTYDLIVSNPPFFNATFSSGNDARDTARQQRTLTHSSLLEGVRPLLSPDGVFSLILPYSSEDAFRRRAETFDLFPFRLTRVRGNPAAPIKRSLIAFSGRKRPLAEDSLTIETKRHQYTGAYIELTRPFYLKM